MVKLAPEILLYHPASTVFGNVTEFFGEIKVCLCIVSCIFKRYQYLQIISDYQHIIHLRTRVLLNIHILDLGHEVPNGFKIVSI